MWSLTVYNRPDTYAHLLKLRGIHLHSTVSHDVSLSKTWMTVWQVLGHHHQPHALAQTAEKWTQ